ncbi:oxygen-insensitive NADPH nitroreductase [Salibacterium salarium]|uniref:Oxygen-insensitive NADPH nitroreductase n=1 Tax=Salibacterium salarium TaxID=284579 RepID=A0A428N4R1_9BACI|nr:oxygen-insensitive NADPH nitroreductase [Salibacterium salarium]RSL33391.1 oxygen-insensitive NADPH nitroreductase [Salibacterium salarium]
MNKTIETILNHRSVRSFKNETISDEKVQQIIQSAQAASTSSFLQAYSIIGVTDQLKKDKIAELAGNQSYVAANGFFFVFCADFKRLQEASVMQNKEISAATESTEGFMLAAIDAALAAQNAAIAAESLGLGICYIGGIRNHLNEVSSILETPEKVLPLFGMAVGYPDSYQEQKPRLPNDLVFHENEYQNDKNQTKKKLLHYDDEILQYYKTRMNTKKEITWTGQVSATLEQTKRLYLNDFVKQKGFLK